MNFKDPDVELYSEEDRARIAAINKRKTLGDAPMITGHSALTVETVDESQDGDTTEYGGREKSPSILDPE